MLDINIVTGIAIAEVRKLRSATARRQRAVASSTAYHLSVRMRRLVERRLSASPGTRWLQRSIRYRKARGPLGALVVVAPKPSRYLHLHIQGGTRKSPWPARIGGRKPAAPGAPVWAARRRHRSALAEGATRFATFDAGDGVHITYRRAAKRGKRGKRAVAIAWVPRARYRRRVPWDTTARRGAPLALREAIRDIERKWGEA